MQQRVTIWILGMFQTSPLFGVEAIVGLIPINLHFHKLSSHAQLRVHSLPHNHILQSLLESRSSNDLTQYPLSLNSLTHCQGENIKGFIINIDNRFNEVFSSFDPLNIEFSPSSRLINAFPSHFSFHPHIKCKDNNLKDHAKQLNNITITASVNYLYTLIISDTGIKNNITTSIAHVYVYDKPIIKTVHYTVNVTSTEAELFTIKCSINQATNIPGISKIIIITNSIHVARLIFDSSVHSFQVYLAVISKELRKFFITNNNNLIKFWECSSHCDWPFFKSIGRDTKQFHQTPLLPYKLSWDFSKKRECNDIIQNWKMTF